MNYDMYMHVTFSINHPKIKTNINYDDDYYSRFLIREHMYI